MATVMTHGSGRRSRKWWSDRIQCQI